MKNEKNQIYYVGLDIGTDSVGYAVTNEKYNLCKFKGEPMWGVTVFEEAMLGQERRSFRTARRRLDRRQQRVSLLQELFAPYICKDDPSFFIRIRETALYSDSNADVNRIFPTLEETQSYNEKYPTIHHLIKDLMQGKADTDVRLLYIACSWLVAHRGHFLNEIDKDNIDSVLDFGKVYDEFCNYLRENDTDIPWDTDACADEIKDILKSKIGIKAKTKALGAVLFDKGKAPAIKEGDMFGWADAIKLLCGGKVSVKDLYGVESYSEIGSVSLDMDDEALAPILAEIDESELILKLKAICDWSVLVDVLKGEATISEGKIKTYEQHKKDLSELKRIIRKYLPEKYSDVFRAVDNPVNYAAYSYHSKNKKFSDKVKGKAKKEDFCAYIKSVLKNTEPDLCDKEIFDDILSRLELGSFMPKQRDGDNRVIPYQLYWHELKAILEKAVSVYPFLAEQDEDGLTLCDKILSVFEFRVPYYVGPLRNDGNNKNAWMVRKCEGKIYPWNYKEKIDLDLSEREFIRRMTNTCTYLPGEYVLPKNSLCYSSFTVLNEINNLKINEEPAPAVIKQRIYTDLFMKNPRVTPKRIRDFLVSNNYIGKDDKLSGLDETIKSSLKPYHAFGRLLNSGILNEADVERIIERATVSEEKARFVKWLDEEYHTLSDADKKYVSSLKFKEFGRFSKKLLCDIEHTDQNTGEVMSVMRAMWETGLNINQLILSEKFTYKAQIEDFTREYYSKHPKSLNDRLDDMYISNAVKRPIFRTLDILKDVIKVQGCAPKAIFVEMARGTNEDQKGKRTLSRYKQLCDLYEKTDSEDTRLLRQRLDDMGEMAENRLQSDKLFLYYMQLGKCLYTGESISIESVISGDGTYNIEHIYPRSFVKDDSILNNKVLVNSKANGEKSDKYPIDPAIQSKMGDYWKYLNSTGHITDEKYKRLIRRHGFTDEEKYAFINRQLVETRQSTKAVASLLKEKYPDTETVYVKAGLVSDFRHQFGMLKSRTINDLHHAKDAYLNIVVGDVYNSYFNKNFFRLEDGYNLKSETMFTHEVKCGSRTVWEGEKSIAQVKRIVGKNTAHLTKFSRYEKGGLFKINPKRASESDTLLPLKKGMETNKYGGYDSAAVSGFILAKYNNGKKTDISFVPLKLLYMSRILSDDSFLMQYVARELGDNATDIEILLNKRIIKIGTMLSLDNLRVCIRGKASKTDIGVVTFTAFKTNNKTEQYLKRLESFYNKYQKNMNIILDEKYDGISCSENVGLYDLYINKLSSSPYNKRPGNATFVNQLNKRKKEFENLDTIAQVKILLQIQGVFGRNKTADLSLLNESASSGITRLSMNLSNWKKYYTDVRIIDSSASGLFEKQSEENLLELL